MPSRGRVKTVGQVAGTNHLRFRPAQNAAEIAQALLAAHSSGGPVIDHVGRFIGFVSELDLLTALESGRDLHQTCAEEIMTRDHLAVTEATTIEEALRLMRERHALVLPVERNGMLADCVTRHDVLRAWLYQAGATT